MFYFAAVNAEDSTWDISYARNDYTVLAFEMEQNEGEFASLRLTVQNSRGVGLLNGPVWLWFSHEGGSGISPLFFGRMIGIPTSLFEEKIELEFVARPADFVEQKTAVAASLKVLPYYDRVFIDQRQEDDLDAVLEAYTKVWHIDPVTHEVGTSDVLVGEEGEIEFQPEDMVYEGLSLNLSQIPLTSVSVRASFQWTQLGQGTLDLTNYIYTQWPNEAFYGSGVITSFTLQASDWPQPEAVIGENWTASTSFCTDVYDLTILSRNESSTIEVNWGPMGGGGTTTSTSTASDQYVKTEPPGSIKLPVIVTDRNYQPQYSKNTELGYSELVSVTDSIEYTDTLIPLRHLKPTLVAAYNAERPRKEIVSFTLTADMQSIVTLPGDDEALKIDLNSVSLNELIDPTEDSVGYLSPIRDARRRSYIVTERGDDSLQYLIALAKANLVKRARCVSITFRAHSLAKATQVSLRKNARIYDPRIPDGTAQGKVTGYRIALDGDSGVLECYVTMGCAVGKDGEVEAVGGTPTYAEEDVMGPDVQEFTGRTLLFDTTVGYEPPSFDPGDDGIDLLSGVTVEQAVEEAMSVEYPPATQRILLRDGVPGYATDMLYKVFGITGEESVAARTEIADGILGNIPTVMSLKLRSMKKSFESERTLTVTQLKLPNMIDLEAGGSA